MSGVRKYAGLPDLDPAPDIYETPELTDDSTLPTTETIRSESPTSSHNADDEPNHIDRHRIDADEARTHFLPTGENESTHASRIGHKRRTYRSSSRNEQRGSQHANGVEPSSEEEGESLERKIARLRKEVAEVQGEIDGRRIRVDEEKSEESRNQEMSLDALSQVLENIDPTATDGKRSAASRLIRNLSTSQLRAASNDNAPHQPPDKNDDGQTYTVSYAPMYHETHTLAKVSEFDARLALLENTLGIDAIPLPTQERSPAKAVIPTLEILDRQLSGLSSATDNSLDRVKRKVRQLTEDADALTKARQNAKAAQDAMSPMSTGPTSGITNDTDAEIDIRTDVEQLSKINALFGTLNTIESLAPLLPSVLDRLRSLRALHVDAAAASQTLADTESKQAAMKDEIQSWKEGLGKVEAAMQSGEHTLQRNTKVMEDWVKELEERVQRLG